MTHVAMMKKALFGSLVVAALAAFTAGCSAPGGPADGGKCGGSAKCGGSSKCGNGN